jgi:MoaA/NifB/PqqE/SkfB family radical SAM enzyme
VRLAGELGAVDLNPMPVDEKGERKRRLSRGQIEEYNRELAPRVAELRARYGMTPDPGRIHPFGTTPREIKQSRDGFYARGFFERRPCLAPWLSSFIAWNGDVYLCCMTNGRMDALGNAGTQSLGEIFQGEPYWKVRRSFLAGEHLKPCHRCDLFLAENARLHAALGEEGAFRPAVLA